MELNSDTNSSCVENLQCLNCQAQLVGPFCHECGQTASIQRYSIKRIGTEVYEQFRKIDALTTLRTFWQLTIQPGDFITSYLAGMRVGFLVPIKYFFYSFVAQVMVGSWLFWVTNDHSLDQMSHVEFRSEIVIFISTGFWGVLWWVFYRRSDLNVVENMVAAVFFVGQCNFFAIILELISFPLRRADLVTKDLSDILGVLVQFVYSFYFARNLFRERYLLLIPKQLVLGFLYCILIIVIFFVAFIIGASTGQLNNLK